MQGTSNPGDRGHGFRPDVEGLRAVAIVAVVVCHAGIAAFAGGYVGVDIFFVISGFLITRLLLEEVASKESISLPRFYARRARRLLPLSALLLAAVGAATLMLLSPLRAQEVAGDIVSSGLYVANWHFAAQSVNYFSHGIEPSPILHLWSLGVEEQFYLVWPGLMLLLFWVGRRLGSPRAALWGGLTLLFAASLAFGIYDAAASPASAYFSTVARGWELALGALLALLGPVRMPRPVAIGVAWAGVAAIAYGVVFFDEATSFPGTPALDPTLGAAALILAGVSLRDAPGITPAGLLSLRPVRYVGQLSYAWYLWHWPVLVFATAILGPLTALEGLAAVLVSLVPTVITHHLVEDPVRHLGSLARAPARGLALGATCMVIAVVAGYMVTHLQPEMPTLPASEAKGAAALDEGFHPEDRAVALRPSPLTARNDQPRTLADGCMVGVQGTSSGPCVYGDRQGRRTIFLFGDSHAMQHFPELEEIATRNRMRLVDLTKAECTPAEVKVQSIETGQEYSTCDAWRRRSLARIERNRGPTTVVLSNYTAYTAFGPHGEELSGRANARALEGGYLATLRRLNNDSRATVVIRDTPEAPADVPSCVSENMSDLEDCAFRERFQWNRSYEVRAARRVPGTTLVNVDPEICPGAICRAVIGNELVYRDNAHLTAAFARSLTPWVERDMKRTMLAEGRPSGATRHA